MDGQQLVFNYFFCIFNVSGIFDNTNIANPIAIIKNMKTSIYNKKNCVSAYSAQSLITQTRAFSNFAVEYLHENIKVCKTIIALYMGPRLNFLCKKVPHSLQLSHYTTYQTDVPLPGQATLVRPWAWGWGRASWVERSWALQGRQQPWGSTTGTGHCRGCSNYGGLLQVLGTAGAVATMMVYHRHSWAHLRQFR